MAGERSGPNGAFALTSQHVRNAFIGVLIGLVLAGCQSGSPRGPVRLQSVHEARGVINASTMAVVPTTPRNINLFDRYAPRADALWARDWTKRLDFTGVAMDQVRTCTLISPRHVLMAQHYQRNPGDVVSFHDRAGRVHQRIIERRLAVPGGLMPDLAVGLLERDVPVTFYQVLPPRADYSEHLVGSLAVITDKDRNLLLRRIAHVGNRHLRYGRAGDFDARYADPLITGDSGNPGFIIVQGQPVLIETHTFGGMGQGPFISDPQNYAAINDLMRELGGGYQLSPIAIGP